MKNFYKKLTKIFIGFIGKIHWRTRRFLTLDQENNIRKLLTEDYFIILTRRKNQLSTFFVNLADYILTGKWGYWAHTLINLEDNVTEDKDFRLMEATGKGVHYSPFEKVFDVQSVALLKPKSMSLTQWTMLLDRAKEQLGKPYDTLFDIADGSSLSCVELVRFILQGLPNYEQDFTNFESLIKKYKNLSPQMIADCGDFEIIYLIPNQCK